MHWWWIIALVAAAWFMVSISLTVTDVSKKFDRLLDATYDIERQIAGLNGQVGLLHGLLQERVDALRPKEELELP